MHSGGVDRFVAAFDSDGNELWVYLVCAEFDLDPTMVAGWLANPDSNRGLLLRGEGSSNRKVAYWFLSREHGNTAGQLQLIIGYDLS